MLIVIAILLFLIFVQLTYVTQALKTIVLGLQAIRADMQKSNPNA